MMFPLLLLLSFATQHMHSFLSPTSILRTYHHNLNEFLAVHSINTSPKLIQHTTKKLLQKNHHHHAAVLYSLKKENNNDNSDEQFINYILSPPSNDPSFRCTHMIGIPLEQNHDLLLELESIQRAILYHCPLLIHACITPVVTRMPLLLIDTKVDVNDMITLQSKSSEEVEKIDMKEILFNRENNGLFDSTSPSAPGENDLLTSRDPITRTIHDIVNAVVNDMINVKKAMSVVENDVDSNKHYDDDVIREGINSDNIKPLFIKFQGLEIDGDSNEVLHAIGTETEGTVLLRNVLKEITTRIEKRGWRAYIPEDNPQGKNGGLDEDGVTWRPRIPFMRLPSDYFETLPSPQGLDGQWQDYSDEQKRNYIRSPEEGGNGISPLFWYKWWDDKLCKGKGVRIRELAVYGRTGPMGVTEQAFYIPHLRTRLPDGNKTVKDDEQKDREYDNRRRMDQEVILDTYDDERSVTSDTKFEKEMAKNKSKDERRMLQTIFDSSPDEDNSSVFDLDQQTYRDDTLTTDKENKFKSEVKDKKDIVKYDIKAKDKDENWNQQNSAESDLRKAKIIQSVAKPIATGDWSSFQRKKDKPDPLNNPILRDWKRKIAESPAISTNESEFIEEEKISPFPSDEHFVGIWTLELFPKSEMFEEENGLFGKDSKEESIVLRVDGTTAGGPILDLQNQHRAAGGTWKFFSAQWTGPSEEGAGAPLRTRLRIRLLIPPSKEKVLVMEGEATNNGSLVTTESITQDNMKELRKSAILSFMDIEKDQREVEKVLQCAGEMWCEDATGAGNGKKTRLKVGRFRLVKQSNRQKKYSYSIPSPQRYQD